MRGWVPAQPQAQPLRPAMAGQLRTLRPWPLPVQHVCLPARCRRTRIMLQRTGALPVCASWRGSPAQAAPGTPHLCCALLPHAPPQLPQRSLCGQQQHRTQRPLRQRCHPLRAAKAEGAQTAENIPPPRPAPFFSREDLKRIKAEGPRMADLYHIHLKRDVPGEEAAQLLAEPDREAVIKRSGTLENDTAVIWVPRSVLGGVHYAPEPDWDKLPRMNFGEFYQGLRERNWTSPHYKPDAQPWTIQFFQDAGRLWRPVFDGYRATVTRADGTTCWVDLAEPGRAAFTEDHLSGGTDGGIWRNKRFGQTTHAADYGYNQVFEEVFQAFEEQVPPEALREFRRYQDVDRSKFAYKCPGEQLLDVSWHQTQPEPSLAGFWAWLPSALALIGGVSFVFVCLAIGLFRPRKMMPTDPIQAVEFAQSKGKARREGTTGVRFGDVAGMDSTLHELREVVEFLKITSKIEYARKEAVAAAEAKRKADAAKGVFSSAEDDEAAARRRKRRKGGAAAEAGLGDLEKGVLTEDEVAAWSRLNAKPPKGILLEGEPGTGKTLVAKAIAGEAGVPFYQMAGSEFVEAIVGVGAARVRDLFKRASVNTPCVIFVDEVDAIGIKRAEAGIQTNEEREQTLNELLTQMDGFQPGQGVLFIAATNRPDLLDPALTRPGRFDQHFTIRRPDTDGREAILRVHAAKRPLAGDVDLGQVAKDLPGLSGAELANVLNEASRLAVRRNASEVSRDDIYNAIDRILQGVRRPGLPARLEVRRALAAHEAAKALVATVLRRQTGRLERVERVSMVPRGRHWTRTIFLRGRDEDYTMTTRARLLERIRVILAGRAAEELAFGHATTYSLADLQDATKLARKVVANYGLSSVGLTTYAPIERRMGGVQRKSFEVQVDNIDTDLFGGELTGGLWQGSDQLGHKERTATHDLLWQAYSEVKAMLEDHQAALEEVTRALLARETLLGADLEALLDAHPPASAASQNGGGSNGRAPVAVR